MITTIQSSTMQLFIIEHIKDCFLARSHHSTTSLWLHMYACAYWYKNDLATTNQIYRYQNAISNTNYDKFGNCQALSESIVGYWHNVMSLCREFEQQSQKNHLWINDHTVWFENLLLWSLHAIVHLFCYISHPKTISVSILIVHACWHEVVGFAGHKNCQVSWAKGASRVAASRRRSRSKISRCDAFVEQGWTRNNNRWTARGCAANQVIWWIYCRLHSCIHQHIGPISHQQADI